MEKKDKKRRKKVKMHFRVHESNERVAKLIGDRATFAFFLSSSKPSERL